MNDARPAGASGAIAAAVDAIVTALQEQANELSELAEEQMRPSLEERAQEWAEAAEIARRIGQQHRINPNETKEKE